MAEEHDSGVPEAKVPPPTVGHPAGSTEPSSPPVGAHTSTAAGAEDWFSRLLIPAYDAKGWLKFLGVVSIIAGAMTALTIFGLVIAWLYIWVGVLFWQAGDRAGQAYGQRDPAMLEQYLQKLKTVIIIAGVATALTVVGSILMLVMGLAFGWLAVIMSQMGV